MTGVQSLLTATDRMVLSLVAILAAALTWPLRATAVPYTLTDLGAIGGSRLGVHGSGATAINAVGQVVGWAFTGLAEFDDQGNEIHHAFLYSGGVMTDLGSLGLTSSGTVTSSFPTAINNSGQVVGWALKGDGSAHAFLYSGGVMTDLLGTLGGPNSEATAINDSGQVVGCALTGDVTGHAFLYSGGVMTDLGRGQATAINPVGQVVGAGHSGHAFLWSNGVLTDLGTLGSKVSVATAINPAGQVVGWASTAFGVDAEGDGLQHAFLYSEGVMTDLGTLGALGSTRSEATAINPAGQVVGWAETGAVASDGTQINHAFLYSEGVMTDLGTLGGRKSGAIAINASGQVVGAAETAGLTSHAFLWSNGVMTDLTLGGFPSGSGSGESFSTAINDSGQVVGEVGLAPDGETDHAFLASPGGTSTVTTTTILTTRTTLTTSTTTLPCTTARCTLAAALMSPACAGQTIPASVIGRFTTAENLIDQAATTHGKKGRKVLRKAKMLLRQAGAKATHAATRKKATLSATCAAALKNAASGVAAGL